MHKIIFLFLFFSYLNCQAQILQDSYAKQLIMSGLDQLYSHDFKESNESFTTFKTKYPKHPAGFLLASMLIQQQYFPLKDHIIQAKSYVENLEKALDLAEVMYLKNSNDLEAAFFCTSSLGFLAAFEADNQNFIKAVNYSKKSYHYLKIGLLNSNKQPEFLYSSGVYNYYRISYPEIHPILKPFMFFFENGNKKLGLAQLEAGIKKTIFVKNESLFYLGYIYNKYEGTPAKALPFNLELIKKFPNNQWYLLQRAELLSLTGNYEGANEYIEKLEKTKSPYYVGCAQTFRGMREEFENRNLTAAESFYAKALNFPWEERFTKDIRGLAYLGLIRIAQKNNQTAKARKYTSIAKEYLEYKNSLLEFNRITGQ
jgi:hypothetical protein